MSLHVQSKRMAYTLREAKALSIAPHITGAMSLLGSFTIIVKLSSSKNSVNEVRKRLMIGLSICDMLGSTGMFLSTWPINSINKEEYEDYVVGNAASCSFQGFLVQWTITVPLYNVMLGIYYLLAVKYRMKDNEMRKIEIAMHAIPVLFGSITACICLSLDLFHDASLWCWIAPSVDGTENSWVLTRWIFFYGPLWTSYVAVTVMMTILCLFVFKQDKKMDQLRRASYSTNVSNRLVNDRKREWRKSSRKLATQSLLYVSVFYVVWICPTLNRIYNQLGIEVPFPLLLLTALLTPFQGFLNCLVFIRPQCYKYRKERKKRKYERKAKIDGRAAVAELEQEQMTFEQLAALDAELSMSEQEQMTFEQLAALDAELSMSEQEFASYQESISEVVP